MNNLFNKMTSLLKKYDSVILMGHQNPDLDAIGSMLGMYEILLKLKITPYLFLKKDNNSYDDTIKEIIKLTNKYNYTYINKYKNIITDKTLLIILDVHQDNRIEYPKILNSKIDVIVLDHHIKNSNYIKNTVLFYIDSSLSSMVELVGHYSKYLNIPFTSITATVMLGGLEIDTNMYNLKTTEQTYKIAAYFTKLGADNILKQNLLKENKADYLRKADFIKKSYTIDNIAICVINNKFKNSELAEIADELLKFEDIEASFVIGKLDNNYIGISARSIGNIDVCTIMKLFNGGGHSNTAAAQIENTTIKEIEQQLKERLENIQ